ncbi:hypothetical protein MTO96_051519 [Rhipicephalus appendiculatus]
MGDNAAAEHDQEPGPGSTMNLGAIVDEVLESKQTQKKGTPASCQRCVRNVRKSCAIPVKRAHPQRSMTASTCVWLFALARSSKQTSRSASGGTFRACRDVHVPAPGSTR